MRDLLPREIDAVEILDARNGCGVGQSVLITCEHASNELPAPYQWSENDLVFKDTHWAYDPGAKELTTLLA